jgi:hypothetical protein
MNMQRHASLALGSGLAGTIAAILMAVLFGLQPVQATAAQALPAPATIVAHGEHTDTVATAAVVVDLGDGAAAVRWVDLAAPLSGLEVLEASGLDVTVAESSFGPAVCAIEQVGCPVDNCFCDADNYWNYSFWDGSAWQSYPVGANDAIVEADGAVEGWRWGAFDGAQASPVRAIAAASALEWLRAQQDAAGGYGESVSAALEALMAVGANRHPAAAWRAGDDAASAEDFLRRMGRRFRRRWCGGGRQAGRGAGGRRRLSPGAAPHPVGFSRRRRGRLRSGQRFQRLGYSGDGCSEPDHPGHRRGRACGPAAGKRRLGMAARLWRRHQHDGAGGAGVDRRGRRPRGPSHCGGAGVFRGCSAA